MTSRARLEQTRPDDGIDVMTDTELEAYARRLATENETLRRQLEFAQRDAEYADDLRDLVRRFTATGTVTEQLNRTIDRADVQPHTEPLKCIGLDPTCPCQDGDVCHYVDDPKSETLAWPVSTTEPEEHTE